MRSGVDLVFCSLVVLTCSSQAGGQSSVLPPVFTLADLQSHARSSASHHLTEAPANEDSQWTQFPAEGDEPTTQTVTVSDTQGTLHSETIAAYSTEATPEHTVAPVLMAASPPSPSAAGHPLSSTLTFQSTAPPHHPSTLLTSKPLIPLSSQPADGAHTTAYPSTFQPQSESLITATTSQPTVTGQPLTSHTGWGPAGPTHREVPSELKVGDDDLGGPRLSPNLDPLLAGLLSVFIVTTAIFFIFLFLKFRQRTNHPEFHRLQDLPMDDLMEDTPLSRYTY